MPHELIEKEVERLEEEIDEAPENREKSAWLMLLQMLLDLDEKTKEQELGLGD